MDQTAENPMLSDAALLAACRCFQEQTFENEERIARWALLEQGWRAHVQRHERFAQATLVKRDRRAAERVLDEHLRIATRLDLRGIDLGLGAVCADIAAKIMLDQVIEHLTADRDCVPAAVRAGGEGT